ncbi:MAG: hypothetical protein L0Z50_23415 [Verrucomicrobiales bacterium]|nr:hypothetical protein [Verrucomicrobiales bacterium]
MNRVFRSQALQALANVALAASALAFGRVWAAENVAIDPDLEKAPLWDNTFNLKTWSGYKDNVLFSPENAVESPFVAVGLDALLWRLPADGWEYLIVASGEYIRYVPGEQVDQEATALAQAQARKDFGNGWETVASADYLYFNQVFDNSLFDREFSSIQVEGHSLTIRPSLRWEFGQGPFLEMEGFVTRQSFKSVVDDEWQAGPKLTLGRTYGNRSEISFGYQLTDRQFDTREPRAPTGDFIAGESLEFFQHEFFAVWRHFWDQQRRWRTLTRFSFQRNDDNESGYYDYYRPRLAHQVRYAAKTWQVQADAKWTYYHYDVQPVGFGDSSLRRKTLVQVSIRGEKNLLKSLKLFVEYEHERSISNLRFDDYQANTVLGGLDWEF